MADFTDTSDLARRQAIDTLNQFGMLGMDTTTPGDNGVAPTNSPELLDPNSEAPSPADLQTVGQALSPLVQPFNPSAPGPQGVPPASLQSPAGVAQSINPMATPAAAPQQPKSAGALIGGTLGQQEDQLNQINTGLAEAETADKTAQIDANKEKLSRAADATAEEANGILKANKEYQAARQLNEQRAAAETADMMQKVQTAFTAQPDPSAYFHESGLRNAMWLMSVAATAIANSDHPERTNQMLTMLQGEVRQNVELQKFNIERAQAGVKLQADVMEKTQALHLADIKEDHELAISSNMALAKIAYAKAAQPGPAQLKAAWTSLGVQQMKEAQKAAGEYEKEVRDSHDKDLNRRNEIRKVNIEEGGKNARQVVEERGKDLRQENEFKNNAAPSVTLPDGAGGTTTITPDSKSSRGFGAKLALTPLEAGAKADAERKSKKFSIPQQTGFKLVDPKTGETSEVPLDDDRYKDWAKQGQGYALAERGYKRIIDLMEKEGVKDIALGSPELKSEAVKLAKAIAVASNGKRLSDADVEQAQTEVAGQKLGSASSRIFTYLTGNEGKSIDVLKKHLDDLPGEAQLDLTNLVDAKDLGNKKVVFSGVDLEGKHLDAPNGEQVLRSVNGLDIKGPQEPSAGDTEGYLHKKAQPVGSAEGLPPVSPKTKSTLDDYSKLFYDGKLTATPGTIEKVANTLASNAVKGKPLNDSGTIIPKAEAQTFASRIQIEAEIATKAAREKLKDLVVEAPSKMTIGSNVQRWKDALSDSTPDKFKDSMRRSGIDPDRVDPQEVEDLWHAAQYKFKFGKYANDKSGWDKVKQEVGDGTEDDKQTPIPRFDN